MTDSKKPTELSEDDLDGVTGGALAQPTLNMEVVNEDELVSTQRPKNRMEVVNEDELMSSSQPGSRIVANGGSNGI